MGFRPPRLGFKFRVKGFGSSVQGLGFKAYRLIESGVWVLGFGV